MTRLFLLLSSLTFITSCKKDDLCLPKQLDTSIIQLNWVDPVCPGMFEDPYTANEPIIQLGNQFSNPSFNPLNPYEFCYYQAVAAPEDLIPSGHQIVKFNLQTGSKTIILENIEVTGNLAWGKNGWIAYQNRTNGGMYAINTTTQEVVELSDMEGNPIDKNLAWLGDSDTLIWGGVNINGVAQIKFGTLTNNGVSDFLVYGTPELVIGKEFTLSAKGKMLSRLDASFALGTQFSYTDFKNIQTSWSEFTIPLHATSFGRVNWHADGVRFYVPTTGSMNGAGLYEVNFNTMMYTKMYDFCDKQFIHQAVCAPNGKYLIIQKVERELIIDPLYVNDPFSFLYNDVVENSKLWLYDLQTKKEAVLPLD